MPCAGDDRMIMPNVKLASIVLLLLAVGCDSQSPPAENPQDDLAPADVPVSPTVEDILPAELQDFWVPWKGDFDGMVERRVVRVLTSYGGYQFYYDEGKPRGATYDMLKAFEDYLNVELGRRNIRVHVLPIPVSRDQLVSSLLLGHGDLIASDLTPTRERQAKMDFTRPILDEIDEVVVMRADDPALEKVEDLSGMEIFVRPSSSYFEHLKFLSGIFEEQQLAPLELVAADELLEAEDIVEMISLGEVDITVMDDYKAEFWAGVLPNIVVRHDLAIATGGSIAWALRKDSPLFAERLDGFLKKYGKGSLFGNDTYNRYLKKAARARCANSTAQSDEIQELVSLFTRYGEQYSIDWLRLAAQAYQESGLRQDRVSSSGAVGIMQIKPSTAADRNVGIEDVTVLENNIHAGTKYLRFIADRYFNHEEIGGLDQWLFSLAAYNAGPARINRLRIEAEDNGYDPTIWFDNVEIIAARRIGRETVTYVSSIFKYYVAYQLTASRQRVHNERFAKILVACNDS